MELRVRVAKLLVRFKEKPFLEEMEENLLKKYLKLDDETLYAELYKLVNDLDLIAEETYGIPF